MRESPHWFLSKDGDDYVREFFDRHYSRIYRKDGRRSKKFIGPGQYILLRTWDCDAIFAWRKFIDDCPGQFGVNCAIFRNESPHKSSALIREADAIADFAWPGERHYTYVNAQKIQSVNPGYCFKRAGWRQCGETRGGLVILERISHEKGVIFSNRNAKTNSIKPLRL